MSLYFSQLSSKATSGLPPVIIKKVIISNEKVDQDRSKSNRPEINMKADPYGKNSIPTKVELVLKINNINIIKSTDYVDNIKIYVQENVDGRENLKSYDFDKSLFEVSEKLQSGQYFLKHISSFPYDNIKRLTYTCWLNLNLDSREGPINEKYSGPKNFETIIEGGKVSKYVSYRDTTSYGTNNKNHYHNVKIDSEGNGYALSGGRFGVDHQHIIQNGIVQVAKNHSHSLIDMMSITDNRSINEASKRDFNLSLSEDVVTKRNIKVNVSGSTKQADKHNKFSDLWISKDDKGNVRSSFMFDPVSVLKENSNFNALYTEENIKNGIFDNYSPVLKDVKIYRDKIKGNSNLNDEATLSSKPVDLFKDPVFGKKQTTKAVGGYEKFDKNESEELVIYSSQKSNKKTIDTFQEPKPRDMANTIKETKTDNKNNFRQISFNDKTLKEKNDGFFQYKTKMSIVDPSLQIINSHLAEISKHKSYLQKFHDDTQFSPPQIKNPVGNPSISAVDEFSKEKFFKRETDISNKARGEEKNIYKKDFYRKTKVNETEDSNSSLSKQFEKSEYVPKNYDERTNSYSKNFKNNPLYSSELRSDGLSNASLEAVRSYFKISKFYNNDFEEKNLNNKSIEVMLSTKYGSPDGILKFSKMLESLEKDINSFVEVSSKGNFDKNVGITRTPEPEPLQKKSKTVKNNVIEIENKFVEAVKAENINNSGIDFMNLGQANDFGLKEISREKLQQISDFELSKLYDTKDGNDLDTSVANYTPGDNVNTTKLSYVTPTIIKMGTEINLKNGSDRPSFGNPTDYSNIAIQTKIMNKKSATKTKVNSFLEATNKLKSENIIKKQVSSDCGTIEASKNSIENSQLEDKNRLSREIENSHLLSKLFSEIDGIVLVDTETSPRGKKNNFFAGKSPVTNLSKEYEKNDLEDVTNLELARAARPIFDSLSRNCDENKINISNFNINSDKSKLKKSLNDWTSKQGTPSELIRNAPNSVKAMIKLRSNSITEQSKVPFRKEFTNLVSGDVSEINVDEFRYKLKTINKLEVLTSFDEITDKGNKNQLKKPELSLPKWQTLTPQILEQNKGKDLTARMVPYENKEFEIKRDKDYELPTFDEYFIIKGN